MTIKEYLFLAFLILGNIFSSAAQIKVDKEKDSCAILIEKYNQSPALFSDSVTKFLSVKYDKGMNVVAITGRVIKTPDPFCVSLGRIYKEYYRKCQTVKVIDAFTEDCNLWNLLTRLKPTFSFLYFGQVSTTIDVDFEDVLFAQNLISKGYQYLESYQAFLLDVYYNSLTKEELVSKLNEEIQSKTKKVPYASTEHIMVSKIDLSADCVITYEYLQDDIKCSERDLFKERLMQLFEIQSWNRGLIKALALNGIRFRYLYVNKSNSKVFSDTTFSGQELLEIYDSINEKNR